MTDLGVFIQATITNQDAVDALDKAQELAQELAAENTDERHSELLHLINTASEGLEAICEQE